jgi:protein-arginine kinase activator protein McsA
MAIHVCEVCGTNVVYHYQVVKDSNGKQKLLCNNCVNKKNNVARILKRELHKTFAAGMFILDMIDAENMRRSEGMRVRRG